MSRWYNETLGTPAEGTSPPQLYHHYTGHDNNRDWYAFTQVETQLTVDSLHNVWHPQIVHDIHQQGEFASRLFLPPYLDPVEPNVDPLITQGVNALGTYMAWELAAQGKRGIVVNAVYDAWAPARAYQHHHAGVRILSETAGANLASPLELKAEQISETGRGYEPRTPSWNYPDPWRGGRWGMSEMVDYESSAALALLKNAVDHADTWLSNFVRIGERAVRGWPGWPYAVVIPKDGQNPAGLSTMLGILDRGGIEIRSALSPFQDAGTTYPQGTYLVVLRQPYASFAKALLETQKYPDLRLYPGGPPKPPYDVTAHTVPLLMGVRVAAITDSIPLPLSTPVHPPKPEYQVAGLGAEARIGLYQGYAASMDEGWTRWVFDTWGIRYAVVTDSVVRAGDLRSRFNSIVLPSASDGAIRNGLSPKLYPPRFAGGLGAAGIDALRRFTEAGGTVVALNEASDFAIRAFGLPVRDVTEGRPAADFYAPGSIFRLELDTTNALTAAMPSKTIAWFENGPVFEVTDRTSVRTLGWYPTDPARVLASGWVLHPERVAGKGALLEAAVGQGRVVLFGFRPQYRGQSIATYPLLFNALRPAEGISGR